MRKYGISIEQTFAAGIGLEPQVIIDDIATKEELYEKQNELISGENIKTINQESVLGSGNLQIEGGSKINIVQTTGTSTESVMSQSAVTKAVSECSSEIPTKLSELENDKAFATSGEVKDAVDGCKAEIPTKLSELENDKAFATSGEVKDAVDGCKAEIPTKLSELTNDCNFAISGVVNSAIEECKSEIPTKLSELENDCNFATTGQLNDYVTLERFNELELAVSYALNSLKDSVDTQADDSLSVLSDEEEDVLNILPDEQALIDEE